MWWSSDPLIGESLASIVDRSIVLHAGDQLGDARRHRFLSTISGRPSRARCNEPGAPSAALIIPSVFTRWPAIREMGVLQHCLKRVRRHAAVAS